MIRLFDRAIDTAQVMQWAEERDYRFSPEVLPPTTWISPQQAVVSIYTTNHPHIGFLDHLLSNPALDDTTRETAVEEVLRCAIKAVRQIGIKRLVMYSSVPAVIERAQTKYQARTGEPRTMIHVDTKVVE